LTFACDPDSTYQDAPQRQISKSQVIFPTHTYTHRLLYLDNERVGKKHHLTVRENDRNIGGALFLTNWTLFDHEKRGRATVASRPGSLRR